MRVRFSPLLIGTAWLALAPGIPVKAQDAPPRSAPSPYASPYLAKPFELATWERSKQAPRTFTVPEALAPQVLATAQTLIANWHERNRARQMMKLQTVSDSRVETRAPTDALHFGLMVATVKLPSGRQFSVRGTSYPGNTFSLAGDPKEADKRADLLAFLLQEQVKELEATPPPSLPASLPATPGAPPMPDKPKRRPEIDASLARIRILLDAGQTEAALAELDRLRALLKKEAPMP